jgi:hypothetical protein
LYQNIIYICTVKLKQQQTIMTTTNQKDENYINDYVMYQDGYLIHGKVKFIKVENQTNTTIINSNLPQLKSKSPHLLENDKIYYGFGILFFSYFLLNILFNH